MLSPISQAEFDSLAKQGYNRIPLVAETFADLDTPLSLYLKLANKPYSYLLKSVQGGEPGMPLGVRGAGYGEDSVGASAREEEGRGLRRRRTRTPCFGRSVMSGSSTTG